MPDLPLLVLPAKKTSFQSATMNNPHTIQLRPYCVLLVFCDSISAALKVKSWLNFHHRHRKQADIFFFAVFAAKKEGVKSEC